MSKRDDFLTLDEFSKVCIENMLKKEKEVVYYLVSYQWQTSAGNWIPDNRTLINVHPTEWFYRQLEDKRGQKISLTFYSEITKEQFDKLSEWI